MKKTGVRIVMMLKPLPNGNLEVLVTSSRDGELLKETLEHDKYTRSGILSAAKSKAWKAITASVKEKEGEWPFEVLHTTDYAVSNTKG